VDSGGDAVRELVVISGKGGTGKTSVTAAFARFASQKVLADCDVDAADLHLVLAPRSGERHEFSGRKRAVLDAARCTSCGVCVEHCRFTALQLDPPRVDPLDCEGCGLCARLCPVGAVRLSPVVSGVWAVDDTAWGPLVHAQLGVAEDNSGKLVSLVRQEARRVAKERGLGTILVDGAPGIGCPVIASLTGSSLVLVVTEPTVAGRHDLGRVVGVVRHFRLPFAVCVNKTDLNPEVAAGVRAQAREAGALFVSTIRYDRAVTRAMVAGGSVVDEEWTRESGGAAEDMRMLWARTERELDRLAGEDEDKGE
jgi:MinD superfamily P-loop ATPase